jgi:type II secretory pathway component GspD/PulD (secretin)
MRGGRLDVILDQLRRVTGKDLIVDPGIQASITVSTEKLTAEEMTDRIIQILNAQGLCLEIVSHGAIRVRCTEAVAESEASESRPEESTASERRAKRASLRQAAPLKEAGSAETLTVIPLKHAVLEEVMEIARPLVGRTATLVAAPSINALFVEASPEDLKTIQVVVSQLDRPSAADVQTKLYALRFAKPSEMYAVVKECMRGPGRVAADDRSKHLIVQVKPSMLALIDMIVEELDMEMPTVKQADPVDATVRRVEGGEAPGQNAPPPARDSELQENLQRHQEQVIRAGLPPTH